MNIRILLALLFGVTVITGCGGGGSADRAVPTSPATNNDGSTVTGVLTAVWTLDTDGPGPAVTDIPLPNFLVRGSDDLTLNAPVADPDNYSDPSVALNALDGWSTTEKWTAKFVEESVGGQKDPASLDPNSVVPGGSVRFFEVAFDLTGAVTGLPGAVLGVNRELTPGLDYVAVASGATVVILPTRPLKELTAYMAVLTNGIRDLDGNDATPDTFYFITKFTEPLIDANGNVTVELVKDLDPTLAIAFEGLRQRTQTHLNAAASVGVDPDDVVVSWTAITQSITPVTKTVRSLTQPAPTTLAPAGINTGDVGGFGLADISIGVITLPYYAGVPTVDNPTAPLSEFWQAAPGAYVPPFDTVGLDPTSTNLTALNPIPVIRDMQTVPLLVTTPNANSGMNKPAAGWPAVIFGHGLTRSRTDALAIADTMAQIGYAVIAMDFPLHGVNPDQDPGQAGFYVENTPFAPVANERHFDMDIWTNATLTPFQPDGLIDPVGLNVILGGISSLLTSRDTVRQGEVDLSVLAVSVPFMDLDGDTLPDFDGSNIGYVGQSWGGLHGAVFAAVEPTVNRAVLSVPPGGLAQVAAASPAYSPLVNGILGGAGIEPGTDLYNRFLFAWQTVFDSADSINWIAEAAQFNAILLHEVIDDTVVPNSLATAPLSGTEPLIRVGGLASLSATRSDPAGIRAAVRFLPPATHGSLLSPAVGSPAATAEMQGQMASFIASFGTTVVVTNPSVLVPE